jgi:predicted Zn-dependent peptidase
LVDDQKQALQVSAFNLEQEDYGIYLVFALPLGNTSLETLEEEIEEEIKKLRTELISERDFNKLQNQFESNYINSNSSVQGIANSLARYYMLYGDTNLINDQIDIYRSITREEIQDVAIKYLLPGKKAVIEYLPEENQ